MGMEDAGLPTDVAAGQAHPARAYDYYLGGKDNFEPDRELGRRTEQVWPTVRVFARENRMFMQRAVRYLAAEEGISQYLDIGSGIPTSPNVHEIAQRVLPSSRVVYVDRDPLVISHARSLLRSTPEGTAGYLYADAREPETILAEVADVLDFSKPVAILMIAVLHFLPDEWNPGAILGTLLEALAPGSFLVASQITSEHDPETIGAAAAVYYKATGMPDSSRSREEFEKLAFTSQGLQVVEPGVTLVSEWRDQERARPTAAQVSCYGAVGKKP
jgi:S-adenosyl methyltransferase